MNGQRRVVSGTICILAIAFCLAFAAGMGFSAEQKEKARPAKIIATDYGSIQEAIDAARELGVYHIYVPSGVYYVDKTLNFTGFTWAPIKKKNPDGTEETIPRNITLTFEGAGRSTILIARTGETPAMDLSGCQPMMIMRNFVLQTPFIEDDSERGYRWLEGSAVGIFMARIKIPKGGAPSSGGHIFENVTVQGAFKTAAVLSWDSEVNRFYNCRFSNAGRGDGFIFTDFNREGVRSPYIENAPSCNTELHFYGSGFYSAGKGGVALRITGASDVSIHGGYIATGEDSFAGIYVDGTGHARNISLHDIRMECRGKHCLYAVGAASDILIEGGQWISQGGEMIRQEDKVRDNNPAHRNVFSRRAEGRAENWIIRNLRPSRNFEYDPALKLKEGKFCAMRFDSLQDSIVENISFQSQYITKDKDGKSKVVVATDIPLVVVEKYSRRNLFRVPSRESVVLKGDAKNNRIIATADAAGEKVPSLWLSGRSSWYGDRKSPTAPRYYDGVNRTYIKPDEGTSLINLGVMDVRKIKSPKKGDIAIHNGSGTKDGKPCPVFFDGKRWISFTTGAELKTE